MTLSQILLHEPVTITIGSVGEASTDVMQVVKILGDATQKWGWLMGVLAPMVDEGEVSLILHPSSLFPLPSSLMPHPSFSHQ